MPFRSPAGHPKPTQPKPGAGNNRSRGAGAPPGLLRFGKRLAAYYCARAEAIEQGVAGPKNPGLAARLLLKAAALGDPVARFRTTTENARTPDITLAAARRGHPQALLSHLEHTMPLDKNRREAAIALLERHADLDTLRRAIRAAETAGQAQTRSELLRLGAARGDFHLQLEHVADHLRQHARLPIAAPGGDRGDFARRTPWRNPAGRRHLGLTPIPVQSTLEAHYHSGAHPSTTTTQSLIIGYYFLAPKNPPQPPEEHTAVRWLTRAAEAGHPDAMYILARRHRDESAEAVLPAAEAARWLRRAAAAGHPMALARLPFAEAAALLRDDPTLAEEFQAKSHLAHGTPLVLALAVIHRAEGRPEEAFRLANAAAALSRVARRMRDEIERDIRGRNPIG